MCCERKTWLAERQRRDVLQVRADGEERRAVVGEHSGSGA
jgi:hypothetical protein